ncbi:putative lumazine-binding protein [Lutibacter sp. Hel_I_33_5]|uniref:nuclear transport factor 2 family protein n=1 Tax=Lutibacter sp. Hel_I_33_5 TaxID=1566289 RepID=UPI0011AB2C29|nr:nuclear transport factor 2 family protein [Lutibacter sp. Hel_I_33_5]TVZ56399.1 putative lumazine-binding protein [Lutibacter sp. Hel_I_33_5]
MHRIITALLVLVITTTIKAQETSEEKAIKLTIETFFKGLQQGDSAIVSSTLNKTIKLQTTYTNKKGKRKLVTETKEQLLKGIANKKPEHTYLEKLMSWEIKIDGNLASVWTPYEFYLNGKFSHCGANSFQLFNNDGGWEIIYLVDMRRRSSCEAYSDEK